MAITMNQRLIVRLYVIWNNFHWLKHTSMHFMQALLHMRCCDVTDKCASYMYIHVCLNNNHTLYMQYNSNYWIHYGRTVCLPVISSRPNFWVHFPEDITQHITHTDTGGCMNTILQPPPIYSSPHPYTIYTMHCSHAHGDITHVHVQLYMYIYKHIKSSIP